jgi:hypothetical protein
LGPVKGRSNDGNCAPVLGSARSRRAVSDQALAPEGRGADALGRHTHLDQSALHDLRPLLREAEIVGEPPGVIGMALDHDG